MSRDKRASPRLIGRRHLPEIPPADGMANGGDRREWVDYVSYCPTLPRKLQMHVRRVERDEVAIAELEREVQAFLAEVEEKMQAS